MSKNLSEALYLGTAILLFALAITFFFSCYNTFEDYVLQGKSKIEQDRLVKISLDYEEEAVTGEKVLFQVLEYNKHKEISEFKNLYESQQNNEPELWVNGQMADSIDISTIDASKSYKVQYETDPSGRIIIVRYTGL